jgi:SAM-dependent methyltransferase
MSVTAPARLYTALHSIYTSPMAMGKRKRQAKQASRWVATQDLPRTAAHPFYRRLNRVLDERHFDAFVEGACATFYAEVMEAVGVDLWKASDQSGNAAAATWRNADAEGVADRVEVKTGDIAALPLADASFDVVLSNAVIHNIKGAKQRNKAIDEAVRVLRPGGRLMIADIFVVRQYADRLRFLGMLDIQQHGLGWRMWWSGPWVPTRVVTAMKPLA